MRDSTLSGNDGGTGGGGASVADGGAVFTNTLVSTNQADRGAGIFANGPLAMTGGEVTGNGDTTTNQGGGIEADGALSLTAIRIDHNTVFNIGGGLFADIRNNEAGQLDRVEIDHNGATSSGMNLTQAGGIASQGHLDIADSYVHDNTTIPGGINGLGGGIWFQPRNNNGVPEPLTITGSTISANTSGGGDGIDLAGASTPSTATITRSTVSGNGQDTAAGAGGGIFVGARQTATLRDVTLAENKSSNGTPAGGNLEVGGQGTANLVNTLVARPFGGGDCEVQASGALHPRRGTPSTTRSTRAGWRAAGDDLSPADLGELADNGGPTPTHAVGPSSPLLGLGGAFCQPTDQRGAPRPQDSGCGRAPTSSTTPRRWPRSAAGPATVGDASPMFAFSANENATFRCTLDGSAPRVCSSPLTVGPLGDGPHIFTVRPTDVAGNQGADVTRSFTVATAATGGGGNAGSGGGGQAGGAPQTGPSASGSSGTAAAPGPGPVAGAAAVTALGIRPRRPGRRARRQRGGRQARRDRVLLDLRARHGDLHRGAPEPQAQGPQAPAQAPARAFTRSATGGANSFRFTGRVAGKALKPGAYRLVATGPGGARTTAFRIIG